LFDENGGGFTLIELLVVIAIIGMLSSVVLASLNSARQKSRDTRRKEDLHQIHNALELYYNTNGTYPSTGAANATANAATDWESSTKAWSTLSAVVPSAIKQLPVDPVNIDIGPFPWTAGQLKNTIYTYQ